MPDTIPMIITLKSYEDSQKVLQRVLDPMEMRQIELEAAVDLSASMLILPEDVASGLGLSPKRKVLAILPDDSMKERSVTGPVIVSILEREVEVSAALAPEGSKPVVGKTVLDLLDLMIDKKTNQVATNPISPKMPSTRMPQ